MHIQGLENLLNLKKEMFVVQKKIVDTFEKSFKREHPVYPLIVTCSGTGKTRLKQKLKKKNLLKGLKMHLIKNTNQLNFFVQFRNGIKISNDELTFKSPAKNANKIILKRSLKAIEIDEKETISKFNTIEDFIDS